MFYQADTNYFTSTLLCSTLPDKTKNSTKTADRLLQHSVEPIVPKFYFQQKIFYILVGFMKNLS